MGDTRARSPSLAVRQHTALSHDGNGRSVHPHSKERPLAKRRKPPTDPQEIMRRRLDQQRENASLEQRAALPCNADMAVVTDERGRKFASHRSDVFDLLRGRGALSDAQHAASRRLQALYADAAGVGGAGPVLELIDGATGQREIVNGHMIAASVTRDNILSRLGHTSAHLLAALIAPCIVHGQVIVWRAVVGRVTGETDGAAQASRVRAACEDLMQAFRELDAQPRRTCA